MSWLQGEIAGKRVHRLGLAGNFGIDEQGIETALDRGLNYAFYTSLKTGGMKQVLRRRRDEVVLAAGGGGPVGATVRWSCHKMLKALGTDHIDIWHLFWAGVTSALTDATFEACERLKEEGKIGAIATSIHDRPRAGRLAADSPLDVLMVRYNAAHPGAEEDIFPHLAPGKEIVAYTATAWRKLLRAPKGWEGPVPSAGDCYRFCLSNPHVAVTLTGPASTAQLDENLAALEKGPMDAEELAWMRAFGKAVHG